MRWTPFGKRIAALMAVFLILMYGVTSGAAFAQAPLRVYGYPPCLDAFIQDVPEIPIEVMDLPYTQVGTCQVQAMIMEGSASWDVAIVDTRDIALDALMAGGFLLDMSSNAAIARATETMYPTLLDALTMDNAIYAVPTCMLYVPAYACGDADASADRGSLDAWIAAGYDESDIPQTLDALYAFMETWAMRPRQERERLAVQYDAAVEGYEAMLLELLIDRYTADYYDRNAPLTFDTPLFRHHLARIGDVCEALNGREFVQEGAYSLIHTHPLSPEDAPRLAPLKLSEDSKGILQGSMGILIINRNSRRQEDALRLAEYCLSALAPETVTQIYKPSGAEDDLAAYAEVMERVRIPGRSILYATDENTLAYLEAKRLFQDGSWDGNRFVEALTAIVTQ